MKKILTSILIAVSLLLLDARFCFSQRQTGAPQSTSQPNQTQATNVKLDEKAMKIKRTVEKIGVAGRLTLYLKNGEELYGNVVRYDDHAVEITEIDLKQVVVVQYQNIKRVREGYGNPNLFTGKRTNPPKGIRIGTFAAVLALVLLIPIIAVASAKD